jgi:hypothetical protein
MYKNYPCQVEHNGKLSEPIIVESGVKQGCLLSPVLFLMVLDIMMTSDEQDKGIQWGLYDKLEDLDFSDYICILAQSFKDMEAKLNDLKVEAQNIGMKINSQKTKEMRVNPKNKDRLYLGDYEFEEVNKFCYLGCMVSQDGGANEDVTDGINKARGAFAQLRPIRT